MTADEAYRDAVNVFGAYTEDALRREAFQRAISALYVLAKKGERQRKTIGWAA
jgi:hypothetical protein